MKLLRLDLPAFGPFTDHSIDLADGSEGLHLIFGPNEAGKSSALRALRHLLYGFPHRTDDAFRHPMNRLRIGGLLRHSNGDELAIIRRKGRLKTLRGPDDATVVAETRLRRFLGGVEESLFQTMFGIDHAGLVQGGEEILQGHGEIGEILFAAGAGLPKIRKILIDLESKADGLFRPRASTTPINAALADYRNTRKAIREAELNAGEWATHDKALNDALTRRKQLDAHYIHTAEAKGRLERIQKALPIIARYKELADESTALADAAVLPPDFSEQRQAAFKDLSVFQNSGERANTQLKTIREELSALTIDPVFLQEADAVTHLFQELGGIRKAEQARRKLEGAQAALRTEIQDILTRLGRDVEPENARSLLLKKTETTRIQELGDRHERLATRLESIRETVNKLESRVAGISAKLDTLPAPGDPAIMADLSAALERVMAQGDLEARLTEETTRMDAAATAVDAALKRLPKWNRTAETLASLPLPSSETIDAWEHKLKNLEDQINRLTEERTAAEADHLDIATRLREIDLGGDVPTEADLAAIRSLRNKGWEYVRRAWESGNADGSEDFTGEFPEAAGLADAFDISIHRADDTADRLRREADRVARKAGLIAEREKIGSRLATIANARETAVAEMETARSKWHALWQPCGITPASPREMRAWLRQCDDIITAITRKQECQQVVRRLNETIHQHLADLMTVLTAADASLKLTDEPLARVIVLARRCLETHQKALRQKEQLAMELADRRQERDDARRGLKAAEADMASWRVQWAEALTPLSLPPDATPAEARAVNEDLEALSGKLKERKRIEEQLRGMERDAEAFRRQATDLAERISPDLSSRPADQAVSAMNGRLMEMRETVTRRKALEKQIKQEEKALEQANAGLAKAEATLKSLCQTARRDHPDQLIEAEERSDKRRRMDAEWHDRSEQLRELSAGATLEDFISDAESVPPDTIEMELKRLSDELVAMDRHKTELGEKIGEERNELARMNGSATAAEKAEEAESILAGLETDVDRYVRRRLSAELLRMAIDRYREEHQGPVLRRAGDLFAQMTLNAFEGLRLDFTGGDTATLVGVRPDGKEIVPVSGMSTGTADQLYLAVRLASLEMYLAKSEPLPFIVDDILIQFDDRRSAATLEILSDLSRKTQIIFFTHHRHLVQLAEAHADPAALFVHTLS